MSEKTIDREAKLLIQLGKMGNKLQETQSLLRELADRHLSDFSSLKLFRMEADRYRGALKKIAAMDTSQDAVPQQCGAVLIAMNALEGIE